MSTTYLAMIVAIVLGVSLLVGIGALSLVSGALNFLLVKPSIKILKSKHGKSGFAFICKWDQDAEPVTFDKVRIRLFNPFGTPTQVDVTKEFDGSSTDFARDVEMGDVLKNITTASALDKATIEVEVTSSRSGVTHQQRYKASDFVKKMGEATQTVDDVAAKFEVTKVTPKFEIPDRTFIAEPMDIKVEKHIVIPTNPIFASVLAGAGGGAAAAGPAAENFTVSKVWIEPGCIVCDACEGIFPEVFEVTDTTCLIRPGAPLDDGLKIQDAAEACPVEVIKFTKAS